MTVWFEPTPCMSRLLGPSSCTSMSVSVRLCAGAGDAPNGQRRRAGKCDGKEARRSRSPGRNGMTVLQGDTSRLRPSKSDAIAGAGPISGNIVNRCCRDVISIHAADGISVPRNPPTALDKLRAGPCIDIGPPAHDCGGPIDGPTDAQRKADMRHPATGQPADAKTRQDGRADWRAASVAARRAAAPQPDGDGAVTLRLAHREGRAGKSGAPRPQTLRHGKRHAAAGRGRRAPRRRAELVRPDAIAHRLGPDAVHQGLLAEADPLPSPELDELEPAGIVLVLDQITDPHNVGAILRTAAGFAVAAIVTTARHSPEATGVLAKSASGALEYVPIVTVQNLARALADAQGARIPARRSRQQGRSRSRRRCAARAARAGARRRRQGLAAIDARDLRPGRAARSAGPDQEPQRLERRGARALCREPAA